MSLPVLPDDVIRCDKYRLSIRARVCVERQFRRARDMNGHGKWTYSRFDYCATSCAFGREVAGRLPEIVRGRARPAPQPLNLPKIVASLDLATAADHTAVLESSHSIQAGEYALTRLAAQDAERMEHLDAATRQHCRICKVVRIVDFTRSGVCQSRICQRALAQEDLTPTPEPDLATHNHQCLDEDAASSMKNDANDPAERARMPQDAPGAARWGDGALARGARPAAALGAGEAA